MKIKRVLAALLSVSMLACLSACSGEDSSSEAKKVETETIQAETETNEVESELNKAESELNKTESELNKAESELNEDEAYNELIEEESSAADDDSKTIEDIAGQYDAEHPEETVLALLEQGFSTSFKDNMRTSYDKNSSLYTIEVWQDGFAAALETDQGASALDTLCTTLESSLQTMTTQVRTLDPNANIKFSFVSDKDEKTPLLTLENGKTVYNITKE